jgi:hypothetical protein
MLCIHTDLRCASRRRAQLLEGAIDHFLQASIRNVLYMITLPSNSTSSVASTIVCPVLCTTILSPVSQNSYMFHTGTPCAGVCEGAQGEGRWRQRRCGARHHRTVRRRLLFGEFDAFVICILCVLNLYSWYYYSTSEGGGDAVR